MNKLVYLFELDSRNKTSNTDGFYALFQEIVHNGNCVAISMNQLTDSAFFTEALKDADTRSHLLKLFEIGALRISRYGKSRTASEYVQAAIDKCEREGEKGFIFSNMPIRGENLMQLKVIGEALKNSDVNRITEELSHCKDFDLIYGFVDTILKLSTMKAVMLPVKNPPGGSFEEYLNIALSLLSKKSFADRIMDEEIKKAVGSLREKDKQIKERRNDRTVWLDSYKGEEDQYPFAIIIINMCYNYTVQDSVSGVCKPYDDQDFVTSFWADFRKRIKNEWRKSSHSYKKVIRNQRWRWNMMIRFAEYRKNDDIDPGGVYTKTALQTKLLWKAQFLGRVVLAFGWAAIYSVLFLGTELIMNWLESMYDLLSTPKYSEFMETMISIVIFGLLGSLANIFYNKVTKGREMPDIVECITGLLVRIWDFVYILIGGLYDKIRMLG